MRKGSLDMGGLMRYAWISLYVVEFNEMLGLLRDHRGVSICFVVHRIIYCHIAMPCMGNWFADT